MRFWRVGIARHAVFSIVLWLRWLGKSAPKNGSCGGSAAQDVAKFAPRLRARAISKSKSLRTERFGALLEVEVAKTHHD